ncbi:MAG: hypothetical protein MI755_15800 [Sphingomonadales bacterium]|nr:hypothetical protein [Sphingomonadales bacterium]
MSRSSAYALRTSDAAFRAEWDSALEEAMDDLEEILRQRATEGVSKPVYYGGEERGSVVQYNDALGMFLLKMHRERKQAEKTEAAGDDGALPEKGASARERLLSKLDDMRKAGSRGKR